MTTWRKPTRDLFFELFFLITFSVCSNNLTPYFKLKTLSDIDFLVTLEPGRTLFDLARLEVRLESLLGRHVDVVTEDGLREPLRSTALREAIRV